MPAITTGVAAYASAITRAIGDFAGTRLFVAAAGLAFVMFASQSVFAPHRLPPAAPPMLTELGLTPGLPTAALLPEVREQLEQAAKAATPFAQDAAAAALSNEAMIAGANYGGAGVTMILLIVAMILLNRRARRPIIPAQMAAGQQDADGRWWAPKHGG
jgi:hypothetical protein